MAESGGLIPDHLPRGQGHLKTIESYFPSTMPPFMLRRIWLLPLCILDDGCPGCLEYGEPNPDRPSGQRLILRISRGFRAWQNIADIRLVHTGLNKTKNRIILTKQSGRPLKLKVIIRCRKKWNEPNLIYIYHLQCEKMQKIQWNSSNGQFHCFHYVR